MRKESLFWNTKSKGLEWSTGRGPMHEDNLARALQRINIREKIDPEKIYTFNIGRKTFVTLATKFLGFPEDLTKVTTHHVSDKMVHRYQDKQYHNVQRATVVGRVLQLYGQGHYTPPIADTMPHMVNGIYGMMRSIWNSQKQMFHLVMRMNYHLKD